jgi:murein endopeptidase
MSNHRDHNDNQQDHQEHNQRDHQRGAPNTQFLDLEISKVLFSDAQQTTREAFHELLKEAAKEELKAKFGEQIQALASLAVDEFIHNTAANLAIESRIQQRQQDQRSFEERLRTLFQNDSGTKSE